MKYSFKLFILTLPATILVNSTALDAAVTIIDDDFTSGSVSTSDDGVRIRERNIDDGWLAAKQGGGSEWTIAGGSLSNASTVNVPGYPNYIPGEAPVATAVSLGSLGIANLETKIDFSFDYSVAAGDTLVVTLWGYTGPFDSSSSDIIANLESRYGLGNSEASTDLDAFNLLNGATTGFGGSTNAFTQIAGASTGTFSASINLATLGATGVTKVNDMSVIALGIAKIEDGLAGTSSISDVTVVAVPEPSTTMLLLGMVACVSMLRRR